MSKLWRTTLKLAVRCLPQKHHEWFAHTHTHTHTHTHKSNMLPHHPFLGRALCVYKICMVFSSAVSNCNCMYDIIPQWHRYDTFCQASTVSTVLLITCVFCFVAGTPPSLPLMALTMRSCSVMTRTSPGRASGVLLSYCVHVLC